MSQDNNMNAANSAARRQFLKRAATLAYVAPVVMSMPVHATTKRTGSGHYSEKPPVSTPPKPKNCPTPPMTNYKPPVMGNFQNFKPVKPSYTLPQTKFVATSSYKLPTYVPYKK